MVPHSLKTLVVFLLFVAVGCGDDTQPSGNNQVDMGESDATTPDMAEPDMSEPDMVEPDMSEPDMAEADMSEPDMSEPDMSEPDMTEPDPNFDPLQVCLSDCNYSGPRWCEVDCDYDGLSNCEESQLGTDSCDEDSDDDGLRDLVELQVGSDPLNPDSDGDGLLDYDETFFGFNPTNPSTYNDNILDGDRWIVSACDDPAGEPVSYFTSSEGDWLVALPPVLGNYTELTIATSTAQNKQAAAVFEDPANEVMAFILTEAPTAGQSTPISVLQALRSRVAATGAIEQDQTSGEFDTHDFHRAAIGRYLIRTSAQSSARQVRDALLFNVASFEPADASGLPVSSGNTYRDFRLFISVTYRESQTNGDRLVYTASIAPAQKFEEREKVRFRMDDITNTTGVASAVDSNQDRCSTFRAGEGNPEADFLWNLDQSGSMFDDYARVKLVANNFYANLNNTSLDYRLAVSTMDEDFFGRPIGTTAWVTDLPSFISRITAIENGSYDCCAEYGLKTSRDGIQWMRSSAAPQSARVRADAQLITVILSDEEDEEFQGVNLGSGPGANLLEQYKQFFIANTIFFAIVEYTTSRYSDGAAYREVAFATGGSAADLLATDIQETIDEIIYAATGLASSYVLPATPISSTLRVYKNAEWVPRSRSNGFDYFANTNSIAFFGTYRPEPADPTQGRYGDDIAVSFSTFIDQSKD